MVLYRSVSCFVVCAAAIAGSGSAAQPPSTSPASATNLLRGCLDEMSDLDGVVFAVRGAGKDPHWYANFGYWSEDASRMLYGDGPGRLCVLSLRTGKITILIDDPKGGVRDPQVHYSGRKILFSWRKGGTHHYNLYEIGIDGQGLRQITTGPYDDIEPTYLPNGDIVFCSSRCNRWVNCWYSQVATLYRCDADGRSLRPISSNTEHDNTPAVLPDGRILYTRWEYTDRSQVDFHHLWTFNPDGTGQMTFFGNMRPGIVMIDAKPIPGTQLVAAIFSPGHGVNEHQGTLTIVNPNAGPDAHDRAVAVKGSPPGVRDPYPLSPRWFLVAHRNRILLVDAVAGVSEPIHTDAHMVHEPSPVRHRPRERVIPDRADFGRATGRMVLADVTRGRNIAGVQRGEVRKLLVLEMLPKPVNYSGGPEPLTYLGTFTLERILGTVPVEEDGSAFFELPAHRPVFFVALDRNDMSVKRMQSWVSVMPGETTGCVGCHEPRTQTAEPRGHLAALRRPPSRIEPFAGLPDVIDYPRDIQPILDRHCVSCHDYDKPEGGVVLCGDRGPTFSHSYWTLVMRKQISDGRNGVGNRPPRSIGTSASPLMKKIDGSHYGAKLTDREWRLIWLWIESGATYSGTYASLGSGMVGMGIFPDPKTPNARTAFSPLLERRCFSCHAVPEESGRVPAGKVALPAILARSIPRATAYERVLADNDPVARRGRDILYNLTRPEKSMLLLAPLARSAGGYEACRTIAPDGRFGERTAVFRDVNDADYQALLRAIQRAAQRLNEIRRFDMPGFRPNEGYVREMKRYGILPASFNRLTDPIDVYKTDEAYWRSFWWTGTAAAGGE